MQTGLKTPGRRSECVFTYVCGTSLIQRRDSVFTRERLIIRINSDILPTECLDDLIYQVHVSPSVGKLVRRRFSDSENRRIFNSVGFR